MPQSSRCIEDVADSVEVCGKVLVRSVKMPRGGRLGPPHGVQSLSFLSNPRLGWWLSIAYSHQSGIPSPFRSTVSTPWEAALARVSTAAREARLQGTNKHRSKIAAASQPHLDMDPVVTGSAGKRDVPSTRLVGKTPNYFVASQATCPAISIRLRQPHHIISTGGTMLCAAWYFTTPH